MTAAALKRWTLVAAIIGLIAMPSRLRRQVLPELSSASINAYRGAIGAGVLIALAGALVAFLGIQDPTNAESPGRAAASKLGR